MVNRRVTIVASFTVAGLHHWPAAHDARFYLRPLHRHLFGIEVALEPEHNDRAVEWHDLAEHARSILEEQVADGFKDDLYLFGTRSCETIADQLFTALKRVYPGLSRVSVSEDGEFTAHVERLHP